VCARHLLLSMMRVEDASAVISKVISQAGALSFGDFVLSSGERTPYFIDLGLLFNYPDLRAEVLSRLAEACEKAERRRRLDAIGAPVVKGAVWAAVVADRMAKRLVVFDGDDGSILHGSIEPGDRILLIDDVLNTGRTLGNCVQIVAEKHGGLVHRVQVVLDRSRRRLLDERLRGVRIGSLITLRQLADQLGFQGLIDPGQQSILLGTY